MEHQIQGLMKTAMESIKGMVDVNTVIGDAVETQDGTVIIPVSRVSLGFVAGGGEYGFAAEGVQARRNGDREGNGHAWPFGGGSGAGVSVAPMGFLIVSQQMVRFLPVDQHAAVERILDAAPELIERLQAAWRRDGKAANAGNGTRYAAAPEGAAGAAGAAHRGGFEDLDDYDDF